MDDDDQEVSAALAEVLRIDPSFVHDPERLTRALLDLLPYQPRAVRLLAHGAALGVPTVSRETARDRLVSEGGMRPEVADWVVTHYWAAIAGEPIGTSTESPGQPTTVRLGIWPDGQATTIVVSATGVFATHTARTARPGTPAVWRRIATPAASSSRDATLVFRAGSATALWSDTDGVHGRDLTHGESRLLVPCEQPRYPLAALADDLGDLDILWTTSRDTLRHSLVRDGLPTHEPADVPFPHRPGERLRCLDVVRHGEHRASLVILTDQGRLLVARWDLKLDDISSWVEIPSPTDVTAAAIVRLADRPTVVACTPVGYLLCVDALAALAGEITWRTIDRPSVLPAAGRTYALSAASGADTAWLAMAEQSGTWLARLALRGDVPVLGAPHRLQL
ncbi:hypothetical protein [Luedemannella helvata]|uniref:Uncharacterized protein n=1 Tax=Luedemannella helvata TaxID=349315 RepID=A0ABP4VY15_9ACTN